MLSQPSGQAVDRRRGDQEQEQAADGLENAVEPLEDDPDLEDAVERSAGPELAHETTGTAEGELTAPR